MATLTGSLRDDAGMLVGGATIQLLDGQNQLVAETITGNENGNLGTYRLGKVDVGKSYQILVTVGEAKRMVGSVTIDGMNHTHDILLSNGASSVTSATSATTATSATSGTSSATTGTTSATTSTDSSTTSGTSSSTTDSSTSSTSSATTDSSTSSTSSSTTDSSTSSTSSSTSSDTSSSTSSVSTATTVSPSITLAPDPEFAQLQSLIGDPQFAITPPVNIEEAKQARNLMTIGFYIRAGVPQAITNLNTILSASNGTRLNLINKSDLLTRHSPTIREILDRSSENTYTETELLVQMRQQFNQGLESAENVNRDFPTLYRNLISLAADDMMGVTPQQIDNNVVFDATQRERLFNFLRRLKAAIIALTESLSYAGSLGTVTLVSKWSKILRNSLTVIQTVGQNYIASDDVDEKHWVSVLSRLVNRPVAENRPFLVHAREGGQLVSDVLLVYQKITSQDGLDKEDESFLRNLFFTSGNIFPNQTVVERLKDNGRLLRDNWPANFGA